MAEAVEEARRRAERSRRAGLFRYQLIQEVTDPGLSARQRGALVRELAGREHDGPAGQKVAVSAQTIRRWVRDWRAGGFEALVPAPARVSARTPAEVLALAAALKKENPQRTAAQVTRILRAQAGWAPSDRTVRRHFERLELNRHIQGRSAESFGRFEADRCNEIWTGDALCRRRHNASRSGWPARRDRIPAAVPVCLLGLRASLTRHRQSSPGAAAGRAHHRRQPPGPAAPPRQRRDHQRRFLQNAPGRS